MTKEQEAMRLALESLELANANNWWGSESIERAINAIKSALANLPNEKLDTVEDPVMWMREEWGPDCGLVYEVYTNVEVEFRDKTNFLPLYAKPPKREWVGLTDEEIAQGNKETWVTQQAFESAAWWVEAKLKEKNT